MKEKLVESLLCPRCYSGVSLDEYGRRSGYVWKGELRCISCGAVYPVTDGLACLATIDRTWKPMLGELLSRVEISEAVLDGHGFEEDRTGDATRYHETVSTLMDRLFREAVRNLRIEEGTRILDVGAGLCETSSCFANLGADVVATDVEYTHLQYVNFFEEDETHAEGVSLPLRNPAVYGSYFSRVMCDAHRLPFEDGIFDIACCRSTLHHLHGIPSALREMSRVTKPGGTVALISEPIRSLLDREEDYLAGIFDYEEGLNERSVPIHYYTLPLRPYCDRFAVQYFEPGRKDRTERVLKALRVDTALRYRDGETLGFGGSFKLLLAGAGINLHARRASRCPRKPKRLRAGDIVCDVDEVLISEQLHREISPARSLRPEVGGPDSYRDRLAALYKKLIDPASVPYELDVFSADRTVLRKGFREPEDAGGRRYRYTHRHAYFFIRNDPGSRNLGLMSAGYPPEAGEATGRVFIDGSPAGSYRIPGGSWKEVVVAKPPSGGEVLEIKVENDMTFIPDRVIGNGDTRELGVGIERVRQF